MNARVLASLGLVITVVGCGLLYQFGLPADVDPTGAQHLVTEDIDETEVAKGKRYRLIGRIGIGLVGLGALLQLGATWM